MRETLDTAVAAAMREAARRAILPRFTAGAPHAGIYKSAGELVTVADRESEAILSERLAALVPGARIVGEEGAHHDPAQLDRLASGTCWIIDPLDGTGNFAAGTGPFGVLVALAQDGVPLGGWLLDPLTDRLCSAWQGEGARIDGERFHTPPWDGGRPLVAVTRLFADTGRRATLMDQMGQACMVMDSPRCAADQYPRVANGGNDATLFTRTIAWDHAAGIVFLNEAGGKAARQDGAGYRCDQPDAGLLIATCPRRWDHVAEILMATGVELAGAHVGTGAGNGVG